MHEKIRSRERMKEANYGRTYETDYLAECCVHRAPRCVHRWNELKASIHTYQGREAEA